MPPSAASRLEQRMGAKLREDLERRAAANRSNNASGAGGKNAALAGSQTSSSAAGAASSSSLTHPNAKAEALYQDGVRAMRAGEFKEAITAFSRAIFLVPGEPLPFVARGEAFVGVCDLRSAVSNFRKAQLLLRDPAVADDVASRLAHIVDAMGVVSLRRGEPKRALTLFDEAIAERGDEAAFRLHRCLALIALDRAREAEISLTALLHNASSDGTATSSGKKPKDGDSTTTKAKKSKPGENAEEDEGRRGGSSIADTDANNEEDAKGEAAADDDEPEGHDGDDKNDDEEDDDDDDAAARDYLLKAQLAVDAEARVLLVHLAMKAGDFPKARQLLESCLQRHYSHPRVQDMERRFDERFMRLRTDAEAALDVHGLTHCIACFPDDADLYRSRALAYIERKAFTLAVQDLFACIQKSGGTNAVASSLMASTLCTVADELAEAGDYPGAVNYYTESLKWDATSTDVHIARGDSLLQLGKHEAALNDYKHALAVDPASSFVRARLATLHDTWGMVLYNQARYELAETEFTRAVGYDGAEPRYPYHRAMTRLLLKDQLGAARDIVTCKHLGATDPNIVKLIRQICGPDPGFGTRASPPRHATTVEIADSQLGGALISPAGGEAQSARREQRRTLGARLGLPLRTATLLRGVTDAAMVARVSETESAMMELRGNREQLLEQQYNPTSIRTAVAAVTNAGRTTTGARQSSSSTAAEPAAALQQSMSASGQTARQQPVPQKAAPPNRREGVSNSAGARLGGGGAGAAPAASSSGRQAAEAAAAARRPGCVWAGASAIAASRLDRVAVSKPTGVPSEYEEQRRQRDRRAQEAALMEEIEREAERKRRHANAQSGVPPPPPEHVVQARARRRPHALVTAKTYELGGAAPRGSGRTDTTRGAALEELLSANPAAVVHRTGTTPLPAHAVGRGNTAGY